MSGTPLTPPAANVSAIFQSTAGTGSNNFITIASGNTGLSGINFAKASGSNFDSWGAIRMSHAASVMAFVTGAVPVASLSSAGLALGTGDSTSTTGSATIRGAAGAGTDIAGGSLTIQGGLATGNAATGDILVKGAPAGTTGTTAQTATTYMTIKGGGSTASYVGIGTTAPQGKLHILNGASGATASTNADELIVENSTTAGISLLSPDANSTSFNFGSTSDSIAAQLQWNTNSNLFAIGSAHSGGSVSLVSGNNAEAVRLDSSGNVGVGTSAPAAKLEVVGGVKIGDNTGSCTSTNNGEIRYVSASSPPYNYCNGSAWVPFESAGFVPAYSKFTASSLSVNANYGVCALKSTGALWCWGYGGNYQLASGANTHLKVPTAATAAFAGPWSSVSLGYVHGCTIKTDGSLWCWGSNAAGQLGNGTTTSATTAPVQVSGTWNQVAANGREASDTIVATYYTCGIKSDNSGWCWGKNSVGNLGLGNTTDYTTPQQVSGSWSTIQGGNFHTCGIKTDNTLWCWGSNVYGQLGIGSTTDQSSPQQVSGSWSSVSVGYHNVCAIKTDGTLWCWGYNGNGQLGDNSTTARSSPVQVNGGGTTWSKVSAGVNLTCAIKTDGSLWCMGGNGQGQVLANSMLVRLTVPTATVTSTLTTGSAWTDVSVGSAGACARRDDSTIYCWGASTYGNNGDPYYGSYFIPVSGS